MDEHNKKEKEMDANILKPKAEVFLDRPTIENIVATSKATYFLFDHVEYPEKGGILVYYKGMLYPKKGFPTPEAVQANDTVKRTFSTIFSTIGTKDMILPIIGLVLTPWRFKKRIIIQLVYNLNRIADWQLQGFYLKKERYCDASRGLREIAERFLLKLGVPEDDAVKCALIVATIFEYDDAYRYRLQDIATEGNHRDLIDRPFKEIKRLAKIYLEREQSDRVKQSFKAIRFIILAAMFYSKIKAAMRYSLSSIEAWNDYRKMKLDNIDRYQVLMRGDYNFLGLTYAERNKIFIEAHTFSLCCEAGVAEEKNWENIIITYCKKCSKKCDWVQRFPEQVEVASYKSQ